jgi:hypothetical protein
LSKIVSLLSIENGLLIFVYFVVLYVRQSNTREPMDELACPGITQVNHNHRRRGWRWDSRSAHTMMLSQARMMRTTIVNGGAMRWVSGLLVMMVATRAPSPMMAEDGMLSMMPADYLRTAMMRLAMMTATGL